jgi:hypothetical protein
MSCSPLLLLFLLLHQSSLPLLPFTPLQLPANPQQQQQQQVGAKDVYSYIMGLVTIIE